MYNQARLKHRRIAKTFALRVHLRDYPKVITTLLLDKVSYFKIPRRRSSRKTIVKLSS